MKINQYGSHQILRDDIKLVNKVLRSNFLTQGPFVEKFENTFSKKVKCKFSSAVNSGTAALHLACIALGLKKSDIFWTTPISFVASANCGLYCGAKIDFVDIDENTYNLCPVLLERKLIKAKALGNLPKVVIPVHLCGQSCDMEDILKRSEQLTIARTEDEIVEAIKRAKEARFMEEDILQYSSNASTRV